MSGAVGFLAPAVLVICRKDGRPLKHTKTWKGASCHAWQEETAPNVMQLLFKARLAIFACVDGIKCVVLFCFKRMQKTTDARKHKAKGTVDTLQQRGDGERENKAMMENLSPAVNVRGVVWFHSCGACSPASSLAVLAFAL